MRFDGKRSRVVMRLPAEERGPFRTNRRLVTRCATRERLSPVAAAARLRDRVNELRINEGMGRDDLVFAGGMHAGMRLT